MTIADFKVYLADFMNRDASLFDVSVTGHTDKVLQSANNAKLLAQRRLDFELARVTAQVVMTPTGGLLSSTTLLDGTAPCRFKRVLNCYRLFGTTWARIPLISQESFLTLQDNQQISNRQFLVRFGDELTLFPNILVNETIRLQGFRWMPEYSTGVTSDFFLTDCTDWMLWKCVQELNAFLKEDQRIPVSSSLMQDAWASLSIWNANLGQTEGDLH